MINTAYTLQDLNNLSKDNMGEHIGIVFTEITENALSAKMPVDHRTKQPYGLLHGGASLVLAETLGSVAAHCSIDAEKQHCVGLEINANHIRSVRDGYVYGIAQPLHVGKKTQVWEIRITNEAHQLVCVSRITMAVLDK